MKVFIAIIAMLVMSEVHAQENKDVKVPGPRKMTAEDYERMLVATGGLVQTPSKGLFIKYINLQKRVPLEKISETVKQIDRIFHFPHVVEESQGDYQSAAALSLKGTNCALVIIVADVVGQPSLLLAPGSRWALVNVSELSVDKPDAEKLVKRVQKELWRAFAYSMGAPNSLSSMCLLRPVIGVEGIDSLKGQTICPEPLSKIMQNAKDMGLSSQKFVPYKKACEEGWAAMPTNHYQKVIWEEVKAKKK
jgi:hypothetical protein